MEDRKLTVHQSIRLYTDFLLRAEDMPKRSPVVIAVMGVTGVGKTHFISQAIRRELDLGNSLHPCQHSLFFPCCGSFLFSPKKPINIRLATTTIQEYPFSYGETEIILVDTPGFDDARRPDILLLEEFVEFLRRITSNGLQLSGIIYLHRINDNRMQGSAQKNLDLLTELCGDDFLEHVILTTTMWDHVDPTLGRDRERDLNESFWKPLVNKGATIMRFMGDNGSALAIINKILRGSLSDGAMPDIQRESIYDNKSLAETKAGSILVDQLEKQAHKQRRWLDEIYQTANEIPEQDGYNSSETEYRQIKKEVEELTRQDKKLRRLEERFSIKASQRSMSSEYGYSAEERQKLEWLQNKYNIHDSDESMSGGNRHAAGQEILGVFAEVPPSITPQLSPDRLFPMGQRDQRKQNLEKADRKTFLGAGLEENSSSSSQIIPHSLARTQPGQRSPVDPYSPTTDNMEIPYRQKYTPPPSHAFGLAGDSRDPNRPMPELPVDPSQNPNKHKWPGGLGRRL